MKKVIPLLFILFCFSCNPKETKDQPIHNEIDEITEKITEKKDSLKRDTLAFVSYNDNFDYSQLNAKKGKEEFSFVNDQNNDRSLLRGDLIAIEYKNDTVFIAGDGGTPTNAQWIVGIKKIKDGPVSKLRKEYNKKIKYHYSENDGFSSSYLDHLYELTEYYIANSKKDLLKISLKNKEQLGYSIEKRKRENKSYFVLGIYTESEHKINTFQWLYIDPETDKICEYDLPNDQLIYFP